MGGPIALKGSDDRALVEEARRRGAAAVAPARAVQALRVLAAEPGLELLTYPGEMGENEAREAGLAPVVVGSTGPATTAADTRAGAEAMRERGARLLLFAGGDGTAVDVLEALGDRLPALGIPAGVKMHSAVFAVNARSAGELALAFLRGHVARTTEAEVMDVAEEGLREGVVSARLFGYLRVPEERSLVQSAKARTLARERTAQAGIARFLVDEVLGDRLFLIGPGTTTRAVLEALGLPKSLLGVDAVRAGRLVERDADERRLLELVASEPAGVVVTPIGGQGFLFGRGNQQLSARVLERVGRERVVVIATEAKIAALAGRPLLVDTGDAALDAAFAGHIKIVTGYKREIVYRIAS